MKTKAQLLIASWLCWIGVAAFAADDVRVIESKKGVLTWETDYFTATAMARTDQKMLFALFDLPESDVLANAFANAIQKEEHLLKVLDKFIFAKLKSDFILPDTSPPQRLLAHPAFAEMRGATGVAVLDFTNEKSPNFQRVVTIYPVTMHVKTATIPDSHWRTLLELPLGSLTQRTLIFAVRTHGDRPQSTDGEPLPILASEAERHSQNQADLQRQGHHQWETRFHQINAQLPNGLLAKEVCAESWPGQSLIDAARECVASWRQSPGHWNAVRSRHSSYGYDMKLGRNGVWYATGIFGSDH